MFLTAASITLLFVVAIVMAWRAIDAMRNGVMGWGTTKPVFIYRRKNPFAFWFFVAMFSVGAVGLTYHAISTVAELVSAA